MRIPALILIVVAVSACVLTGFWVYASHAASHAIDAWMAREQAEGQHWSCPNRVISGFPFALDISCEKPAFAGVLGSDQARLALTGLHIRATLLDPFHASVDLAGPFTYAALDDQADFAISWTSMSAVIGGLPRMPDTVTFMGAGVVATGRFWSQDSQAHRATNFDVTLHLAQDGPAKPLEFKKALEFKIDIAGAKEPDIDGVLGGPPSETGISLAGRITKPVFVNLPAPSVMELWRQAGGDITFWQARLVHGASVVEAAGPLHIDPQHRIAGHLDASFTGLAPVLRRYGINPDLAKAGALLSNLFGKHPNSSQAGSGDVHVPVELSGGRAGVGPFLTPVAIPPLY